MTPFTWFILILFGTTGVASFVFALYYNRPVKVRDEHERGIW